jgi:hypothetical protein
LPTSLAIALVATGSSPRFGSGTDSSKFSIFFFCFRTVFRSFSYGVHEIGLGRVDDGDDIEGQRSEESGVLTDNLSIEEGAGRL